jgi:hypothetical protein
MLCLGVPRMLDRINIVAILSKNKLLGDRFLADFNTLAIDGHGDSASPLVKRVGQESKPRFSLGLCTWGSMQHVHVSILWNASCYITVCMGSKSYGLLAE